MPSFLRALLNLLARARYLLPALVLAASAALSEHPATLAPLLLALPLYFVGAAAALGYHLEQDFARFALRRGSVCLALIAAYAALIAVATGWPALRLVESGTPLAALALALGFLFALVVLWRHWPVFALVLLWDDAYPESESGSWMLTAIRRGNEFAGHLTLERDPYFGRGLPLALLLIVALSAAMAIAGLGGVLPSEFRTLAVWLYALVLAPATALAFLVRTERLLLADAADHELADSEAARAPNPTPRITTRDPERLRVELLEAAAAGQVERALALLEQGADANAQPAPHERDQRSLALLASTCTDLRLLRAAIARGADVNRAVGDLTPLLAATRDSYQGRADVVMTLLANGADPRLADGQGNTPLHHAALAREPAVAAILLDAEAPIDALNREGATPLALACAAGNLVLARFLLERGASTQPEHGVAALVAAASGSDDRADLVKLLLKHRAQPTLRDRLGRTALHAAALHGHGEMADALIGAGAELNARDQLGITPLMEAARGGHNRVLQRLVFRRPETEHADGAGRTALLIACQSARANEDTVRLVLAMGADPQHPSKEGRRALDIAVAAGRWPVVKLLDPSYPLPASLTRDDIEPSEDGHAPDRAALLVRALRHGRLELGHELCRLSPAMSSPELADAYVACADAGAARAAFDLLLRQGLDPNEHDPSGAGVLQRLARLDPLPLAAIAGLLEAGAMPGGAVGHRLIVALMEAGDADADDETMALALLDRGADPFRQDAKGRGLLHLAAQRGRRRLLLALLERGLDPNVRDQRGRTPLGELAAMPESGSLELARALLRCGADPERRTSDGQTSLGAALAAGRGELARWLSSEVWRYPGRALLPTDLPAAAALGDRAAIERLLGLGLELESRDAQGCTALIRAAGAGHAPLVTWLLLQGADALAAAGTGVHALSAALSGGREEAVLALLEHGVPVDAPVPGGITPLMIAAALGQVASVKRLLARGAQVNLRDEQGQTCLHAACQFAFQSADPGAARALIEALLGAGAELDAASRAGQTPLLLLLGARAAAGSPSPQRGLTELTELLLARGADPDAQDQRGVGVLHAAAMHGLADPCRSLLRAGADPGLRDTLGRTAAEVALMLGYADLAAEIKRAAGARLRAQGLQTR